MPPFLLFLLGAVAGAVASTLAPQLQRNARPILKEAFKAGILLARGAQVNAVELMETFEDVYAEAKAETDGSISIREPTARAAARKRAPAAARKASARKTATAAVKRGAKQPRKRAVKSGTVEVA